jgi:TldD protein
MKSATTAAIDAARAAGANYADARAINLRNEDIEIRNGQIATLDQSETTGIGIRVLVAGAWGFACSDSLAPEAVARAAKSAVKVAKASGMCKTADVRLADEPAHRDFWATPCAIDPFKVPLDQKLDLLKRIDAVLREKPEIKVATSSMSFQREEQVYADSNGSVIHQILVRSGAGYSARAVGNGDSQIRSYPQSWGGNHKGMGYEIVTQYDMLGNAARIRDEAIALLSAPDCPQGKTTLILDGPQMALQIHESVGHANELDRVLGFEANYAGRSFMTPELHRPGFKYGSDLVNLVADSTVPTGLATFGYDDDGVQAQRFHVVQTGQHKTWFTTRETAALMGFGRSNSCNRAQGFSNIPITRIPNLSLMPGESSLEQLISETDDGILMEVNRSWSIDQMRLNFQFGCEVGRIIKGGKVTGLCKNPTYQGMTPEFWGSCDGIASNAEWDLWGVINCGKGQPGQVAEMSHGAAPTRFRGVTVGVR